MAQAKLKYHYWRCPFTYSVRRSDRGASYRWGEPPRNSRLKSPATPCAAAYGARAREGERVCLKPGRSDPRTVSGGEFDWGGTSVKR